MAGPLVLLIGRGIAWAVGAGVVESLVGRAIAALGVSFVTYTGVSAAVAASKAYLLQSLNGLPAELLALASMAKLGTCMAILFSGLTARLALDGLSQAGDFVRARFSKG